MVALTFDDWSFFTKNIIREKAKSNSKLNLQRISPLSSKIQRNECKYKLANAK